MSFVPDIPQEDLKKERAVARALRGTTWWKRKRAAGRCYYCGAHVSPGNLTMDHLIPLVRGGRSTRNNIVAACKECNSRKKYLLPLEWETYLASLSEDD